MSSPTSAFPSTRVVMLRSETKRNGIATASTGGSRRNWASGRAPCRFPGHRRRTLASTSSPISSSRPRPWKWGTTTRAWEQSSSTRHHGTSRSSCSGAAGPGADKTSVPGPSWCSPTMGATDWHSSLTNPSSTHRSRPRASRLGNQSVRKMQAAMCLIDWIAVRLGADGSQRWSARWILARPDGGSIEQIQACLRLLGEVLDGGAAQHDLIAFVQSSLGLSEEETQSVCWEYPRSLMLEVVPTAYRRLSSGWSTVQIARSDPGHGHHRAATTTRVHPVDLVQRSRAAGSGDRRRRPVTTRQPIPPCPLGWPSTNSPRAR